MARLHSQEVQLFAFVMVDLADPGMAGREQALFPVATFPRTYASRGVTPVTVAAP